MTERRSKIVDWLPRQGNPVLDANGRFTREWYNFLREITVRFGGVDGVTIGEVQRIALLAQSASDLAHQLAEAAGIKAQDALDAVAAIGGRKTYSQSDSTDSDTVTATLDAFASSKPNRKVTAEFSYNSVKSTSTNDGFSETRYSGTVVIEVSADGSTWTQIASFGIFGTNGKYGEPGLTNYISAAAGKTTLTDSTAGYSLQYRARQATGTMQFVAGGTSSRYIEIRVEE